MTGTRLALAGRNGSPLLDSQPHGRGSGIPLARARQPDAEIG
jgi:hypothetical protein